MLFRSDASEEKLTITGTNGQTALDVADGNLVVADNVDIEIGRASCRERV